MSSIKDTLDSFLNLNAELLELEKRDNKTARFLYKSSHSGIDALATNEGVILCFASAEAKKNAKVASKETFNAVCSLARNPSYSSLLFGEKTTFDNVEQMLKVYEKFRWADFNQANSAEGQQLRAYMFNKLKIKYPDFSDTKINNIINAKASGGAFNNNELKKFGDTTITNIGGCLDTRLLPDGNYQEYDATIFVDDKGHRDAERFVVGNSKVYYTGQHYATFIRVR